MTQPNSRREFLKTTGRVAAATTMISAAAPNVHAGEDSTIRIALVGCGGRGTGAALNALSVDNGPIQLVALADVFQRNLDSTYAALSGHNKIGAKVDVPDERKFLGFDAYRQAMDQLRPGDVVILATPPGFRWVHYSYAIEKGLNVFMEKPVTVDAPTSVRMLEINKQAIEKNLKVAVGLMCRHCRGRMEMFDRIQSGEIGDIHMLRAYRMAGKTASAAVEPNDGSMPHLHHQIKNFHGFLWLSGGAVSDFLIHNIDESCWMKNAWPEKAIAIGGRHYRENCVDQNFDNYAIEYTFADGAKLFVDGRTVPGCKQEFASFAHGTKGTGIISTASHTPAKSRLFSDQAMTKDKMTWAFPQPEPNPYDLEWVDLIDAIREDRPYNEVERGVMASAVTSMGRMAAHTGQEITLAKFMKHDHEFAPNIDKLTMDGDSPLMPNDKGLYSIPMPGLVKNREYL
ncbi:Gfo/Idh/MocA family protein [Rubripirellula reticaptiva]|uniref:Inositol 2-dehydrogenase/D-chiro-inositol 3-dehydrogenase n=1 Tax=Rubripirellula reticaptiva TaxID=2528013 RepID=A0A5C6EG62_9BACT|nr:Gfo/Idh/MocA family oxidoreductase [Rubripirellula reticaptiva]TWU47962.1 Inositol 2-dehydrogenase/D-chiro-inositol 3-dehydrogenase [Rubripirellula reticaptiva]